MSAALSKYERPWFVVSRWQQFAGEARANLLRVVALVAFYAVQLYQFLFLNERNDAAVSFQREVTLIVAAWSLVALAVLICLRRGVLPERLKYLSSAADIALLTLMARAGEGATGPLVHVYFLILATAALRFSLGLVWFTTIASAIAYLGLVGMADDSWFDAEHTIPVIDQLITLVSLGLAGIILGQVVRRARPMALQFAERAAQHSEGA